MEVLEGAWSTPRGRKQPQSKAFVKAARELGCDTSEEAFDRALKKVASSPPKKAVKPKKKEKPAK